LRPVSPFTAALFYYKQGEGEGEREGERGGGERDEIPEQIDD